MIGPLGGTDGSEFRQSIEKERGMKRNFWKGILVLATAIFLAGTVFQVGCKPNNEEQKRLELLKTNEWLSLKFQAMVGESAEARCHYSLVHLYMGTKESVSIGIFTQGESSESSQFYNIYGTGDKISEVNWSLGLSGPNIRISVPKMKSNVPLPEQTIIQLIKRGTEYYFMARKGLGVDTYEGLKKAIEREKERLGKLIK